MTDHPLAKLVPLLTLHESTTQGGRRRLKGYMGTVPVVGFFDDRATTIHPKWDLFVDIAKHDYDLREADRNRRAPDSKAGNAADIDREDDPTSGLRTFLRR